MLHEDEILSDNTKIKRCVQCKDCVFVGGDAFSNRFDKTCCKMFPFPGIKPRYVIDNTKDCEYKETEKELKHGD